ncbi:hypothetical protein ACE6H2_004324 [Prunus campanulata]
MGRVKLQIKMIENTTNRQVTYSKRRNGLIKKAYELSVLCDVDVALIMFSPSGRLSLFSGNKSIEEILARYVNLPGHERGGRIFEGDLSEVTTLHEAEYREQILEETLKRLHVRKVHAPPATTNVDEFVTASPHNILVDRLPPQRDPQVQILNFLNANGLLPLRREAQSRLEVIAAPQSSTLLHGINPEDQMNPGRGSSLNMLNFLQGVLVKLMREADQTYQATRIFEGDLSEVTTLHEAEYREQILEETLKCLHMRKVLAHLQLQQM